MSADQMIAFAVLGATLVLFVWGRWRYDIVAIFSLMAVVITGLVPAEQAFSGFAHPAVITVAAVLIISRGLQNAGIVDVVVKSIAPLRGRENLQLAAQCLVILVLSSFMNNVGALALMLPVALRNAYRDGYSPAKTLMPLAFASLLGGVTTLIGTPPNLIVASFRAKASGESFGLFDYTPVGLVVAGTGLIFLVLIGWRLIPIKGRKPEAGQAFAIEGYITEAAVPEESRAIGMTIAELEKLADDDVIIAGLIHDETRRLVPSGTMRVQSGDILVLRGDADALKSIIDAAGLKLVGDQEIRREDLKSENVDLVEVVVSPGSNLIGATPISSRLRTVYGINLLAIARQGRRIEERLGHVQFQAGDVMLLQGPSSTMSDSLARIECLPLAERSLGIGRQRRLALAGGIFLAAIILVAMNMLTAAVAFIGTAGLFVATNIVRPTEVYTSVDWPVVVLLGAMFPLGTALETSGSAGLIAQSILSVTSGLTPAWMLVILMIVAMILTDIINNSATALLMSPIAITLAEQLGVSIDAFLMAVAIGASCAFLTPIGHQSNTLVMEPGGYRFADYWRVGLPMQILLIAVAVPALLVFWPL